MTVSERKAREALDNPITRNGIWPSLSADDLRELLRLLDEARAICYAWERRCDEVRAKLERCEGLLREVMGEGVEHNADKYALVQMSHGLRESIRAALKEPRT